MVVGNESGVVDASVSVVREEDERWHPAIRSGDWCDVRRSRRPVGMVSFLLHRKEPFFLMSTVDKSPATDLTDECEVPVTSRRHWGWKSIVVCVMSRNQGGSFVCWSQLHLGLALVYIGITFYAECSALPPRLKSVCVKCRLVSSGASPDSCTKASISS